MKKRSIFIFLAVSIILSLFISIIYIVKASSIVEAKAHSNVHSVATETAAYLDNNVQNTHDDIAFYIENSTKEKGELVSELYSKYSSRFIGFGYCEGISGEDPKLVSYAGKDDYELFAFNFSHSERFFAQQCAITNLSRFFDNLTDEQNEVVIFYHFDDYFAFQPFSAYETMLSSAYPEGTRYLVSTGDGLILANSFSDDMSMSSIFRMSVDPFPGFVADILAGEGQSKIMKLNKGLSHLVTVSTCLEDFNDDGVYIFVIVDNIYITNFLNSLLIITAIYNAFFIVINVGMALTMYFTKRSSRDLIIPFSYEDHYVLLVGEDGKIISKNKRFSKSKYNCGNLLRTGVVELKEQNTEELKNLLETASSLTLRYVFDDKIEDINFLILNSKIGYQLIAEAYDDAYIARDRKGSRRGVSIDYAYQDDFYDILNRKALLERLKDTIANKKKYLNVYFVCCSLKNHDEITRLYGQHIHEMINTEVINRLKKALGNNEIYSINDNFFAFFVHLKDNFNDLRRQMEVINKEQRHPISIYSSDSIVEPYFGIYPLSLIEANEDPTPRGIINKAIIAYNRARQSKDQNYYLYDINSESLIEREQIVADDIKKGIENNEFETHFQPVYNLKEDRVSGFECLLRWNNDKYRFESPYEYIKVAEHAGYIHDIGIFTFRKALELLKELNRDDIRVSVNVSLAQFMQAGFTTDVINLFKEYDVPYSSVAMEITETFFAESIQEITDKLEYIRSFGIKIYLDDFGTGYSSLLYLAEFPVDVIKIDKEFTNQIKANESVRTIMSYLIGMANAIGLDVVAEGVETDYQLKFYERQKCNYIQGYYFSKPLPMSEVQKALEIKRSDV